MQKYYILHILRSQLHVLVLITRYFFHQIKKKTLKAIIFFILITFFPYDIWSVIRYNKYINIIIALNDLYGSYTIISDFWRSNINI